jgi:hypothetical protein
MKEVKISFTPSEQNLYEIRNWVDYPDSSMGTINDCYNKSTLVIATLNDEAIAYYALKKVGVTIFIILAEIMLDKIERKLQNTKYKAFNLYCSPKDSQFYWKKMGFEYYPENPRKNRNEKINMFKIFAPVLKNTDLIERNNEDEYLEVWNDKSSCIENTPPCWVWKLEFIRKDSRALKLPFLFFGDRNWKIRWTKGSKEIKKCDYRDFDRKNEIYEYMFIDKMPSI